MIPRIIYSIIKFVFIIPKACIMMKIVDIHRTNTYRISKRQRKRQIRDSFPAEFQHGVHCLFPGGENTHADIIGFLAGLHGIDIAMKHFHRSSQVVCFPVGAVFNGPGAGRAHLITPYILYLGVEE